MNIFFFLNFEAGDKYIGKWENNVEVGLGIQ